jgi:hypothetical protein
MDGPGDMLKYLMVILRVLVLRSSKRAGIASKSSPVLSLTSPVLGSTLKLAA